MINEDFSKRRKIQDVGRWYVTDFVKNIAANMAEGTFVLDAGAGECVYKKFFAHCQYKAIDLAVGEDRWNYSNLDYIAPLHEMPIDDGMFDAVLCTQVLEHLEWPRESVAEMYRVLKPGGKLYMTVPMAQSEHQVPYDFFRYTSYGIMSICRQAGFKDVEIVPLGGLWVRWAYELPRAMSMMPSTGFQTGGINCKGVMLLPLKCFVLGMIRALQFAFLWLDRFDKHRNDPFGWSCVAIK